MGTIVKRILHPSQILTALKALPRLTKLEQIASRLYMNRRYAAISGRIRKARLAASKSRFGENITFGELLLRKNERATIFLKGTKVADKPSPLVQLTVS
jgi:hypothetical protein